jgi:hypothetical protein
VSQAVVFQKLLGILQRYANVPASEVSTLTAALDELKPYDTEAELLADTAPTTGVLAYAVDTDRFWFRAGSNWQAGPSATNSGGSLFTAGALNFTVDYNLVGAVASLPAGTVFTTQAQIDAYLTSAGTTAFKYIKDVYDALPQFVQHVVTFNCAAGAHRPRSTDTSIAWVFNSKFVGPTGRIVVQGAASSLYNVYAGTTANNAISVVQTGSDDPFLTCTGTPFTGLDLKGAMAVISTGQVAMIHDNDNSTIRLCNALSPTPVAGTHTVTIALPATEFRNTLNDSTIAASSNILEVSLGGMYGPLTNSGFNQEIDFNDIVFKPYACNFGFRSGIACRITRCVFDYLSYSPFAFNTNALAVAGARNFTLTTCAIMADVGLGNLLDGLINASDCENISFTTCYFRGSENAISLDRCTSSSQSVVFDRVGSSGGDGYFAMRVGPGSIKSFQNISRGKINEFRGNTTAVAGLMVFAGGVLRQGVRPEVRFKSWAGPAISLQPGAAIDATIGNAVSGQPGGFIDGGGNGDVGVDLVGPGSIAKLDVNCTVTGALGDLRLSGEIVSHAVALTTRGATSQPGGTLAGIVKVVDVEDGTTAGSGTLAFTFVGSLLAYTAPGDSAGTGVAITTGGFFTLKSNNGKSVTVQVKPTLPGANDSQTFTIARVARTSTRLFNAPGCAVDKIS